MILVWLAAALAGPEDGLDEGAKGFFLRAEEEAAARRPDRAAALYRLVLGNDPDFLPASLGLGRALEAMGERAEAEALYRGLGDEPDAVEALARLVEPRDPAESVRLWRRLETLRLGDATPYREQARILAESDIEAAFSAYDRYAVLLQGAEPDGATLLAVGSALVASERVSEAEALWRSYLDTFPAGSVAPQLRARLDRLDVERAAAGLALGGSEPMPAELAPRFAAAQLAFAEGRLEDADAAARALLVAAPGTAEVHALLADIAVSGKRWEDAEIHAVLAGALAPDDASNHVRLGLLLAEAYGGRRDLEAAEELREAAVLRPNDPEIQLALGQVEQRLGDWQRAIVAFEAAMAAGATDAAAEDARRRLDALRRAPPPTADVPPSAAPALPSDAVGPYRVARELARRGRPVEAIQELEAALHRAPDAPALLNLRARLAGEAGAPREAETWLLRSRKADPAQPAVVLALADLAKARGDVGAEEALYEEAAALGAADAHFHLARLAAARDDWGRVVRELSAYDAAAPGRASLNAAAAAELRARVRGRLLRQRVVLAGVVVLLLGVPAVLLLRWRTARTLRDLLDGAPECWHDAARLLSALRHEVLKHNTTVLPDVAEALARGEDGPWTAFRARAPELLAHFRSYLTQLESLGRRHGMRLDLRRKDPILGPMHQALARLARLRRAPRPEDLRSLSGVINGVGYRAIGAIVREICVLPVTPDRVRGVYERVAAEPGFAGAPLPTPTIVAREQGLAVRMFRADLEDILANLLRNALAAGARRVDVELGAFDDPITGHPWVEVAVVDDAPGTLTNAMIRGRYIGRGLGLAVDLINRHGGSIRVETRGEGTKGVVVQLPGVEASAVEAEWTVA